jgi:DnaJ-domain-containing protein 1
MNILEEAQALASKVSNDPDIRKAFKKMLLQNDEEERLRKRYDRIFNKNHPKHQSYKAALHRFLDIMEQQAKNLLNEVDNLQATVKVG